MSDNQKIPLNSWQKEVLKSLKEVWTSVHDCRKVHADFVLKKTSKKNNDNKKDKWYLHISPIVQEVLGGMEDGATKTSCFNIDLTKLILMSDWQISSIVTKTICSFCKDNNDLPVVEIKAKYKDCPIHISIYLSPLHGTIQDTICLHQKK